MLGIAVMTSGQGNYYANLAREDYYLEGGEPAGIWAGEGARKLGFADLQKVEREEFLELFDGFHGGTALVQNAGMERHRPGWDLTFSAPKSVSTAWSQADRETAVEIQAAQQEAVEKALRYLEENALWTRRGKAGCELERCEGVFATFEHGTSRAQDPQLHTHALLLNIGIRNDGTTGSLETRAIFIHKMVAGALYRAELAHQLNRRLGFDIEADRFAFKLKGVEAKLVDEFSKRRKEIEDELSKKGFRSARASEFAALGTRGTKEHVARGKLYEEWKRIGKELGWSRQELQEIMKGTQPERDQDAALKKAFANTVETITETRAFFTERDLIKALAEGAQVLACGVDAVLKAAKNGLENSKEVVLLGQRNNEKVYTTKEMLRLENEIFVMATKRSDAAADKTALSESVLTSVLGSRLTMKPEQEKALRHITQDTAGIAVVSGMAGTGKTFMLDAVREALETSGYTVRGAAVAGKAAQGLQQGAGIKSSTIALLLLRIAMGFEKLDQKTVLVIDEAGMLGTRQLHKLMSITQRTGTKMVLVGDERQLQPIEAGGPFAALVKKLGAVTLTDIVRQDDEWKRDAVKDFAAGNSKEALKAYAERGFVSVASTRDEARENLITSWGHAGLGKPEENLILAANNNDCRDLNLRIQGLRAAHGHLSNSSVKVSDAEFHQGDRILFTENSSAIGVKNGMLGTIVKISELTKRMEVLLDTDGEGEHLLKFSARNYTAIKLGYAVTTHKAQGMTAKNVFILTDEMMQDRELTYVQASRAKGETRFFTTQAEAGKELSDLSKTMGRSHPKEMASTYQSTPSQTQAATQQR